MTKLFFTYMLIATWAESYTKLLAFNQTQYDRVLSLDSDSTVLQIMDELFLLPSSPVAMPRAYWLAQQPHNFLSSQMVLIQPSKMEFDRIMNAINTATADEFDMEIVNKLYGDSGMILPHRPYNLLTGEFRGTNHSRCLGNDFEVWDPDQVLREAKFLRFSDWPTPKPWLASDNQLDSNKPKCGEDSEGVETTCRNQELWLGFYSDFTRRRNVSPILPRSPVLDH